MATILLLYAMDRDNHWERITKAYEAMVSGSGEVFASADAAIKASYDKKFMMKKCCQL